MDAIPEEVNVSINGRQLMHSIVGTPYEDDEMVYQFMNTDQLNIQSNNCQGNLELTIAKEDKNTIPLSEYNHFTLSDPGFYRIEIQCQNERTTRWINIRKSATKIEKKPIETKEPKQIKVKPAPVDNTASIISCINRTLEHLSDLMTQHNISDDYQLTVEFEKLKNNKSLNSSSDISKLRELQNINLTFLETNIINKINKTSGIKVSRFRC